MKKEYQDDFDNFIKEGLKKQAEIEMRAVENDNSLADLPDDLKESMRQKIQERIRKAEEEKKQEKYAGLSEEDKKALELGRKMLEEGNVTEFKAPAKKRMSRRGKLHLQHVLGFVAVLAVVMLVEVNSLGGPEKVVQMIKREVIDRDVEQINASSDSKIIVEENEEEAYQTIADEFEVEPVRIFIKPDEMKFEKLELDKNMQVAEMIYTYNNENIRYIINATYKDTAIGNDFEDGLTEEYWLESAKAKVLVREYETPETKAKYYLAQYEYNGLEYEIVGLMSKSDFENIIKNLFF